MIGLPRLVSPGPSTVEARSSSNTCAFAVEAIAATILRAGDACRG